MAPIELSDSDGGSSPGPGMAIPPATFPQITRSRLSTAEVAIWDQLSSPTARVEETPVRTRAPLEVDLSAAPTPTAPPPTVVIASPTPARKKRRLLKKSEHEAVRAQKASAADQERENQLTRLRQLFPGRPLADIEQALRAANGNVTIAANRLLPRANSNQSSASSTPAPSPIQTRPKRAIILDEDDDDGNDEYEQPMRRSPAKPEPVILQLPDNDDALENIESEEEEDPDAERVVAFFNTSQVDEFMDYTQCSAEQARLVVSLRPFADMDDLRAKIARSKGITQRIIDTYISVRDSFESLDGLIEECENIANQLQDAISTWDDPAAERKPYLLEQQPSLISKELQLKGYQLYGVSWLTLLYMKKLCGILADDMGLGKTAQVIAFFAHLLEIGHSGPHLVVVPASTLDNWIREFARWVPGDELRVVAYKGSQSERAILADQIRRSMQPVHVVVTNYNVATGAKEDRAFLRKMKFHSMVLDEGHMVKNVESQRYKHLNAVGARFRLLLSGTPLQNDLTELCALLQFTLPDIFARSDDWRRIFKLKSLESISSERVERAKKIMLPFVLRRKKIQVLSELPPKNVSVEMCDLKGPQRDLYAQLLEESKGSLTNTKRFKNYLMDLRKSALHPLLFRRIYTDAALKPLARKLMKEEAYWDANPDYVYEDLQHCSDFEIHSLCRKFPAIAQYALKNEEWMQATKVQALARLLAECKQRGDRCLIFSQFTMMLDVLEECLTTLQYEYRRLDGATVVSSRQGLIDEFQDNQDIFCFLLSTKAGGLGLNLTAANVVILHDLDFNPHNDLQAEDRSWRLGQKKPVQVIKLVCRNTIEELIYQRQEAKLELDQKVTHGANAAVPSNDDYERDVVAMLASQLGAANNDVEYLSQAVVDLERAEAADQNAPDTASDASWGTASGL